MKVYLTMLAVSMLFALLYQINSNKIDNYLSKDSPYIKKREVDRSLCKIVAVLSAIPFLLVTCLRYRVGTDYMYYAESVRRVQDGKKSYFSNPIYNLMEKVASFSTEYVAIFCVTGVVLITCYWFVIYKRSSFPLYSIFLFIGTNTFFVSLNGVRQGVAMAFLFVAIHFAIKRDLRAYILFVLLAFLTHRGVAFFFPVYWLINLELKPKRAWLVMFISIVLGVLGSGLLFLIIRMAGYGRYISSMYDTGEFELYITLINFVIFCVFCFYERVASNTEYKREFQAYFWLQLLATASIILSIAIPLAKRICWTFSIGQILSIPLLSKFESSKIGKLVLNCGVVLGFSLSIYFGIVVNGAHKVIPYCWWFERFK